MYWKIPSKWHDYDGLKSGESPHLIWGHHNHVTYWVSWISMINQIWLKINLNQNKDATL